MAVAKKRETTEPPADEVKKDLPWKDAVKAALEKKRPPEGFPKQPSTKHKGGKA